MMYYTIFYSFIKIFFLYKKRPLQILICNSQIFYNLFKSTLNIGNLNLTYIIFLITANKPPIDAMITPIYPTTPASEVFGVSLLFGCPINNSSS